MSTALAIPRGSTAVSLEKLFSIVLVGAALALLNPFQIQNAVIVLGQGHFFACYYYQYKYGQMNRRYLIRYFTGLVLIFGGYILYPNFFLLVTAASVYFVLHLLVDERFLWKETPSLQRGLAFLPFFLIYMGLIVDNIFVGHVTLDFWLARVQNMPVSILGLWVAPYCLAAAGLAAVGYFLFLWRNGLRVGLHDFYFLLGSAVLALLYFTHHVPNHYYLMGAIILFHYSSWYLHYWLRWRDDVLKRRNYLFHMILINALVFGLYALYRFLPDNLVVEFIPREIYPFKDPTRGNALAYLFSPGYFYLWTLMHFVSTARLSDLGYLKARQN